MNLEELQTARDRERQTDKLQQLRESFYADAGEFIQQLRAERDRAAERADDPFDAPEVNRLTDEINTAEQTVEAIYEKRVGKIVKAASFAAADLPAEADGMTAEEQELFETLVDDIKTNREQVMASLAGEDTSQPASTADDATGVSAADLMGEGPTEEPAPPTGVPPAAESAPDLPPESQDDAETEKASKNGPEPPVAGPAGDKVDSGESRGATPDHSANSGSPTSATPGASSTSTGEPQATGRDSPETEQSGKPKAAAHQGEAVRNDGGQPQSEIERRTVRVTADIETFVGSDERDYDLNREDIVQLPEPNATLLIERDAAEQL